MRISCSVFRSNSPSVDSPSFPTHLTLCSVFLFTPIVSNLCCPYTLGIWVANEAQVHSHKENWHTLSPRRYQLPMTSQQGWDLMPTSNLLFGLSLAQVCTALVHAFTISVSSFVFLSCWIWRILLACSHPPCLTLKSFLLPFLKWFLRRGCNIMFRAEPSQSLILYTLTSCGSLLLINICFPGDGWEMH